MRTKSCDERMILKDRWTCLVNEMSTKQYKCDHLFFDIVGKAELRLVLHTDTNIYVYNVSNIVSPAQTEWGGSVVQRAAANQVQLIDLSSSPHQGDDALAVPAGSSIVQRRPARRHRWWLWQHFLTKLGWSALGRQDRVPSQMIFYINLCSTTQQQVETVNVSVNRGEERMSLKN